jgi:glutaredoxin
MAETPKQQHCSMANVWFSWFALLLMVAIAWFLRGWPTAAFIAVAAVGFEVAYLRLFPRLSTLLGYGSVQDLAPAGLPATVTLPTVTLYSASLCPFCPIVRRRLQMLAQEHGFAVAEVDVTLRPDLVRQKGIRGVPVVEADGRLLHGNATTAQLLALVSPSPATASERPDGAAALAGAR